MNDQTLPQRSQTLPFDEIAESITERVDDPSSSGLDYYVGLEHLDSDSLRISRWGSPSDVIATKLRFYPGDVVYARRRAYQRKLGVAEWDGICSAHALVLRARPEVCLPRFLPYFLQSNQFHQRALEISVGSLSPTINWRTLVKCEFALPSLKHQRHVVEVLRSIEECLLRTNELGHALTGMAESIVNEAEDQALHWSALDDILLEPPRNGLTIRPAADETGVWSLTVGSMSEHGYSPHGCRPIEPPSNADRHVVRPGDLFVTRSNTLERVGLPARIPPDAPAPLYYSDLLMRLRPDQSRMPTELLEHLLRGRRARSFVRSIAAGTSASMKKINARNLRRLPVPLFPRGRAEHTVSRLSLLDAARSRQTAHAEATQSLLSRTRETLLSGRSDV